MKFFAHPFEKPTLLKAAGYLFLLALCAKVVFFYASRHPARHELVVVDGIVRTVRLGGPGSATWFRIQSDRGLHRYSSYYGKAWPGMERIRRGDRVQVLAESNKLNRNEIISGKTFYIWEMIHEDRVIVDYEAIHAMVTAKEAAANRYANGFLAASAVFLAIAYMRSRIYSG